MSLLVRDSCAGDVAQIARIYAHWVRHGFGTFELEPPDEMEIASRRIAVLASGHCHLVAEDRGGDVLGYAYAGPYRQRPGYRFSCENSVYVAADVGRRGIGRALMAGLIDRCEAKGLRLMVAVIGDSENHASIGLHRVMGFSHAGLLPAVGWKHNRWVDTVFMTRALGQGCSSVP
ncbi:MAG TPA: GNAT family N-acetyltransferase [Rhizomicrobium sp.]|jgi:phosphinothricin acetyltransferase